MKQIDETAKHRVFVAWVDFMKAIVSSLKLYDTTVFLKFLLELGMTSQRFLLFALNKRYRKHRH